MPATSVEIIAKKEMVDQPIVWRLSKLFDVVTNIARARVTRDFGHVTLGISGEEQEVDQAVDYLRSLGVVAGEPSAGFRQPANPEATVSLSNTIFVRVNTVTPAQTSEPVLFRLGAESGVVVNIARAAFDADDGGFFEVGLSGSLIDVQRSIAYLHTTGVHVDPRQRSVTDFGNL